mmetsp:Transcript_55121/g.112740  ORF Transcript_55121/g.112740 Transcript_55121/m.112740 type:complete len:273 (-) Transcript_55121:150-968(-)
MAQGGLRPVLHGRLVHHPQHVQGQGGRRASVGRSLLVGLGVVSRRDRSGRLQDGGARRLARRRPHPASRDPRARVVALSVLLFRHPVPRGRHRFGLSQGQARGVRAPLVPGSPHAQDGARHPSAPCGGVDDELRRRLRVGPRFDDLLLHGRHGQRVRAHEGRSPRAQPRGSPQRQGQKARDRRRLLEGVGRHGGGRPASSRARGHGGCLGHQRLALDASLRRVGIDDLQGGGQGQAGEVHARLQRRLHRERSHRDFRMGRKEGLQVGALPGL